MPRYFTLFLLLLLCFLPVDSYSQHEKPFVIPEIKEWSGGEGDFVLTSKSKVLYTDVCLQATAEALAADYQLLFGKRLKVRQVPADYAKTTNHIVLSLQEDATLGREGYAVTIGDEVRLTASAAQGAYWGTRTLLQLWEQGEGVKLPRGFLRDFPDYAVRGFMIDCGRKFIPLDYLRNYVKIMAYYKMNTLQVHLNDNGFKKYFQNDWDETYAAFRMESEFFPELTARDGHYGKDEFRTFQKEAAALGVEIIPEIDVPAHSLAFTHYRKDFGNEEFGVDHLDLLNPAIYPFLDSLFTEYLDGEDPVFVGPRVHIGTDEYSNKRQEVVEKFRSFTDRYIKYVEGFGKQACIWGSLSYARGNTPVKANNVVMSLWNNGYANPKDMLEQGYELISMNDGQVYIVPAAGYYYDYLNEPYLYKQWSPATIGNAKFDEKHPGILGGMYAVWNDVVGNGISVKDIHHRAFPALQTLAVKMWSPSAVTVPFEDFNAKRAALSEAPGVNELGVIRGPSQSVVYTQEKVKPGQVLPYEEIGYNYSITFDIDYRPEARGTVLFRSANAEFYLADPISGMIGFSRDGYLNTFKYSVRPGCKETLRIEGDNRSTRLFVNGKLFQELDYEQRMAFDAKPYNYVRTLVFPLRTAGDFQSGVTNLKVANYCISKNN